MNGMLVAFEGPDASGKSTLSIKLEEKLTLIGINSKRFYFPSDLPTGHAIRQIISNKNISKHYNWKSMSMLFIADMIGKFRSDINKFIESGGIAITDRYIGSTLAYQTFMNGQKDESIRFIQQLREELPDSDITFFTSCDSETTIRRLMKRSTVDSYESKIIEHIGEFVEHHKESVKLCSKRVVHVSTDEDVDSSVEKCVNIIKQFHS